MEASKMIGGDHGLLDQMDMDAILVQQITSHIPYLAIDSESVT
jgi:hypothetical protein